MDIELIEKIEIWKASIKNYKAIIFGMYGKYPGEKLIESHCKIYNIPCPMPKIEKEYFVPEPVDYLFGAESEG